MYHYIHRFVKLLDGRITASWLILLIDSAIVWMSFLLAQVIRYNFYLSQIPWPSVLFNSFIVLFASVFFFILFRSYSSIIRHTSLSDIIRVFQATTVTLIFLVIVSFANAYYNFNSLLRLPLSILMIFYLNTMFSLIFTRIFIKLIYHNAFHPDRNSFKHILIYGAGELGITTKNTLMGSGSQKYKIVGFVDDNTAKVGKSIDGIRVYAPAMVDADFILKKGVDELIFSIQKIDDQKKKATIDELIKLDITIKVVPTVERWINGELQEKQIERLRIEDLLQRDPIKLDNLNVCDAIKAKVVCVTGGAGSIGSEIVRQLLKYEPTKVLVIDNAESPVFELRQELVVNGTSENEKVLEFIIADITDTARLHAIFAQWKPTILYHAAAYKHVPLMEAHPEEALRVNVLGTRNVADIAVYHGVERFVMVSTDKAVRPTNVMGASKRLAEMYCQSLGQSKNITTKFVTTRFGNVLGSNGSVVNIFRKQINAGGPITVTHPDITRFFMTIPEACQLVLEASIMGSGSDIFVFDMGEPVKVDDLARKMIHLAGFKPGQDIDIVYSGLRPGEKLYEELLSSTENTIETYHPKIMIAKIDQILNGGVKHAIDELKDALCNYDQFELVSILKKTIPEYKSNNSVFQKLDAL